MSTEVERKEQNLAAQGSVVASMTGVSRLTGFLRDVVLSAVLGATAGADVFFVALRIPNFFRRMFAEGAFAQAFVPVLAEYRNVADDKALQNFVRVVCGDFGLFWSQSAPWVFWARRDWFWFSRRAFLMIQKSSTSPWTWFE